MDLKNSTILITGGSSGIGLEMVKQLTEEGATIIITGRNLDALNKTKAQYPKVHIFQSDVSKPGDIEQLYKDVKEQFPKLNIIVNNAGAMRLLDLQDSSIDLENVTREININLTGTVQMVHQFLPHLLQQTASAIVNVSSGIAFMPYSAAPVYSATKAGVRAYTQALRLQLQDTNVKVFEMIPPGVNTNLQNEWIIHPRPSQMMEVDKMVNVVVKSLKNDTLEMKPFLINLLKTMSRIAPGMLMKFGHREFKNFKAKAKSL
ncbi:SDR family oxidoreductase [Chitinophaga sp. XS-30]|uniref:SDR family oxidoreductase n=1 Tax=Chitinophaga sp. XS-30 TaxID=2604421 RepID=UPI0011DD2D82|nr:SDR family NAD(P)-dependent oxidoreductase [Chitinophaga sp. XS-30]QEH40746.1 SDR family NAD(P)-dependent oxidoreductase [Chitinophaga sp. XS-30]